MKIKLLFLTIAMLLLVPSVNAVLNDAYAYLSFDNADNIEGNKLKDLANTTHNFTNSSALSKKNLILGEAYQFTQAPSRYITMNKKLNYSGTWTMVAWINSSSDGATDQSIIRPASGTGDNAMLFASGAGNDNKARCLSDAAVDGGSAVSTSLVTGVPTMVVCRFNGTHMNIYINKTLEAIDTQATPDDTNTDIFIGAHSSAAENFIGYIDELGIWERPLDVGCNDVGEVCTGEIADLFNNGVGFNPYSADTIVPSLSVVYPINQSSLDGIQYFFYLNGTASDNTALSNIFHNNTLWGNNTGTNASWSFLNVSSIPEGNYTINISANDTSGNKFSYLANFTVDFTKPILIKILPVSSIEIFADGIDINVSASDNYELFAYNLTCVNSSSENVTTHYIEDLNVSTYAPRVYLNWSSQSLGMFNCSVQVWDSHTHSYINDASVTLNPFDRSISFVYPEDSITLRLEGSSDLINFKDISYTKLLDRYTIDINFNGNFKDKSRSFFLSSSSHLYYKSISKYRGHFVSSGGLWYDFEGPIGSLQIERLSDNSFRITEQSDSINLNYNSLGKLNYASLNFTVTKDIFRSSSSIGGGGGGVFTEDVVEVSSDQVITFDILIQRFRVNPSFGTADALILYPLQKIVNFLVLILGGVTVPEGMTSQQFSSQSYDTFISNPTGTNLLTLIKSFFYIFISSANASIVN